MRFTMNALVLSLFSIVIAMPRALGQVEQPTASLQGQRCAVSCRFINEDGITLNAPTLLLRDGQEGFVSDLKESPFVTGVTQVIDRETKEVVRMPHIVVLPDGTKVTVAVAGQQPNGASVDVTVERTKIGKVDIKQIDPDTTLQIPHIDTYKKRVIDFVRFGDKVVIPSGEKNTNARTPCVEIVVKIAENS